MLCVVDDADFELGCPGTVVTTPNCPKCGSALIYLPPVREVSTLVARVLMFLAVVAVVGTFELFGSSAPPYAVDGALIVALLIYAYVAWRTHRDPGPGYLSCPGCKRYRTEVPQNGHTT
jgi:hypothetical protein